MADKIRIPQLTHLYKPLDFDVMPTGMRITIEREGMQIKEYYIGGLPRAEAMARRKKAMDRARELKAEIWITIPCSYEDSNTVGNAKHA